MVDWETKVPLKIAIDYDDTFTADKGMWYSIINIMKTSGCDVRFVTFRFESTSRYSNEDILRDSDQVNIPIIFCNGKQKAHIVEELGFDVNIWIDDSPFYIPSFEKLVGMAEGCIKNNDLGGSHKEFNRVNSFMTQLNSEKESNKYSRDTLVIEG